MVLARLVFVQMMAVVRKCLYQVLLEFVRAFESLDHKMVVDLTLKQNIKKACTTVK